MSHLSAVSTDVASSSPRRDFVKGCHANDKARASASIKSAAARRGGCRKHPATAEIDYQPHEVAFSMAVHGWRVQHPGRFPANSDLLKILVKLGWRLVGEGHKVVPLEPGDEGFVPKAGLRVFASQD